MKNLEEINIRHIKLSTGEELIGIILTHSELDKEYPSDLLIVQNPLSIRMESVQGGTSFIFYDWLPLTDDEVCFINPLNVLTHTECSTDVKEQYINACTNDGESDQYELEPEQITFNGNSNNKLH